MSTFNCQCTDATATLPDPRKHVNYVQGMVLGVDDLIQEFTYHQNQRQWLARDTIGYGTLNGLRVEVTPDLKISVTPGTALSPRGQLIRVAPRQCAGINDWLALADTQEKIKNLGNNFGTYVVLCFRDCKVDALPVPGEPCRCEDQAIAPSRILDDFRLEFRLTPPAQREEDAIRDFVAWLRQIKVSDATASSSLDNFLNAIRSAAQNLSSPLESPPDFLYGSPPQSLVIPAAQLCEYLRAALKLWVMELRPIWQAQWTERTGGGCGCHGDEETVVADAEECLLLAALTINLTGGQVISTNDVVVDDSRRPFVVHLRMLQEMLMCGPCCGGDCDDRTFATVFALDDHTLRIWIHHPLPVTLDDVTVQLEIDDNPVTVFTIKQADSGGSPPGGLNVFDLDLGTSPPEPLQRGDRVKLKFDTQLMTEAGSLPRTLVEAQAAGGWCYPDTQDGVVTVMAIVDLAGTITGPLPSDTTPVGEAFGAPGSSGVLIPYSRADHVHPMAPLPFIPQAANAPDDLPVAENVFTNTPPDVGTSEKFARADHTHGTPPDPIPLHVANVNAHDNHVIAGDVTGVLKATLVVGLQGVDVSAKPTSPADDGKVLTFNGGSWQAQPLPPANPVGDFVEHPGKAGRYLIVAAGRFNCRDGTPIGPVYNGLKAIGPNGAGFFTLTFGGAGGGTGPAGRYVNPEAAEIPAFMYIVKGTVISGKLRGDFHVAAFLASGIKVQVISANGDTPMDSFMVEISLYGKF